METGLRERYRDSFRASPAEMVLLCLVGLTIVGGAALIFVRKSDPPPPPIERIRAASSAKEASGAKPTPAPAKTLLVHVAGMVAAPGVYELPEGSRVKDAISAAGGPKDGGDIQALNLAAPLTDGQKISVGKPGETMAAAEPPVAGASVGTAGSGSGGKINLNTATSAELDSLPSIGPVLAERILSFRQQKGRFTSVSQLKDIEGIGPKKYEGIKDLVIV